MKPRNSEHQIATDITQHTADSEQHSLAQPVETDVHNQTAPGHPEPDKQAEQCDSHTSAST
jgi:hypothetical protein